jgi:hypothetical protein
MKPESVVSELMNALFYGEILSGRGVPEVKGLFEREGLTV